jgi:tocopherol O-methyltransferase
MLLPPLCTQQGYVDLARDAGFDVLSDPKDISKDVSKTWYVACCPRELPSGTVE